MSDIRLKVLVVDDEPPIRKLLRMGLSTQDYEVLEAPSGRAALELLSKKPDLIILDLGLPDIAGHELLRQSRTRDESVPIVVLSSRGDEAGKVQALDLGADDYVTNLSAWRNSLRVCGRLCGIGSKCKENARSSIPGSYLLTWSAARSCSASAR